VKLLKLEIASHPMANAAAQNACEAHVAKIFPDFMKALRWKVFGWTIQEKTLK
jgi:hypothetical protein